MLRSLISSTAKNHFPTHAWHSSPLSPRLPLPPFVGRTGSALCVSWEVRVNPVLFFTESKSPCGFVTVQAQAEDESSSAISIASYFKEKRRGEDLFQAALAEFPHTSLVTHNVANLHHFKAAPNMKYSTARITITTHSTPKKRELHGMNSLPTFNFENLMIIGSNRTPVPQREPPLEWRLHL